MVRFVETMKKVMPVALIGAMALASAAQAGEVDGFRSARFGQKEKEVIAAAVKDLGVKAEAIKTTKDDSLKVTVLSAKLPRFAPLETAATVNYVMGYQCNCLMQVSVSWDIPEGKDVEARKTAMRGVGALVGKFQAQKWGKDETVVNRLPGEAKEGEESTIIFFRGQNKDGGAITLAGAPVKMEKGKAGEGLVANIDNIKGVSLIYEKDAAKPDIYRVDVSGF